MDAAPDSDPLARTMVRQWTRERRWDAIGRGVLAAWILATGLVAWRFGGQWVPKGWERFDTPIRAALHVGGFTLGWIVFMAVRGSAFLVEDMRTPKGGAEPPSSTPPAAPGPSSSEEEN